MLRKLLSRLAAARRPPRSAPLTAAAGAQETALRVGVALQRHEAGQLEEARRLYEEVLGLDAENIDALHFLGVIEYQQGRHAQAEQLISSALARNASNPQAHNNLGNVLLARGDAEQAAASYRTAIALRADYVDAHLNLGSVLLKQGKSDEAAACYERGLAAAPRSARLHFGLASVRADRGKLDEAIDGFRAALAIQPAYPEAYNGLAAALYALARVAEAEEAYRAALTLKPDFPQAKFGLALAKLMQGDYAEGFALFEARFEKSALGEPASAALLDRLNPLRSVPRWGGERVAAKTLLVWTDQGFGDTLMFMRYLRLLKARGFARVIVQCEPPLARLLKADPGVDEVVLQEARAPFGDFDLHCPMSSLPLAFGTRLESIPSATRYVSVPDAMKEQWARRLAGVGPLRVGLIWAGRRDFPKDALRSIHLQRFAPLFEVRGVAFVSLQKGDAAAQTAGTGWAILDYMDECADLLDTAALIEQLDLVIGVDTGVMHLAAALGRPTWLLNRFESEWRWMLDREDSGWYPTLKIFRQREPGAWEEVLLRAAEALRHFAGADSAQEADRLIAEGRQAEDAGDLRAACERYRQAVAHAPRHAAAHLNLGIGLEATGDRAGALQSYEAALAVDPRNAYANYNLGKLHFQGGAFALAERHLCAALERKANFAEAQIVLAGVLEARGDAAGAAAAFEAATRQRPEDFGAWYGYGKVLRTLGRDGDAETAFQRAAAVDPANPDAHAALFDLTEARGDLVGAAGHLDRVLTARPDWVAARYNLGCVLMRMGRLDEAEAEFRRVLARDPGFALVYRMLGSLLHRRGRIAELLDTCDRGRLHDPMSFEIESFQLFGLNFVDSMTAEELFARHKAFGERLERSVAQRFRTYANDRNPDRKLRVGYVSGDFSFHPVALFLHPLLQRHDRTRFDTYCYSVGTTTDAMTRRIIDAANVWRDVRSIPETQLGETIQRDGIDILVDLSGHSGISRLTTFAQRPAPVQTSWLGYLNTTGLTRMQYRMTDSYCDPPGVTDRLHTETLVRLPHSQWCYRPFLAVEGCATPPHETNGSITFGVFTQIAKLTAAMRSLWARILARVPGSRLVIAGVVDDRMRADLLQAFAQEGMDASRLTLMPFLPVEAYLRSFDTVDVVLDTFPYSGGTTTCDALWMGVPVVTMTGPRSASRSAASILSSLDLDDWITTSPEEYMERAVRSASQRELITELRRSLRDRMRASPLMQEQQFARDVEAAYRAMWQAWCSKPDA